MSALSPSCWGMSQAIIAAPLHEERQPRQALKHLGMSRGWAPTCSLHSGSGQGQ